MGLVKREYLDTDMHKTRMPCDHVGRDESDVSTSHECQGSPANHWELGEAGTDSPPLPQREPTLLMP